MNKKIFVAIPLVILLSGCGIFNRNNKTSISGNTSSTSLSSGSQSGSSSGSSSSSSSISETSYTYVGTFTFDFTGTDFTAATHLDNETNINKLKTYMNKSGTVVSSISATNMHFQPVGNPSNNINSLTIGSSGGPGSITFDFVYKIKQISFTIQAYNKYIKYSSSWSSDPDALVQVEGRNYHIGIDSVDEAPDPVSDTIALEIYKNEITFYNNSLGQRSYIHNLSVECYE